MNAKQLAEALAELPQDAEVIFQGYSGYLTVDGPVLAYAEKVGEFIVPQVWYPAYGGYRGEDFTIPVIVINSNV